jgi:hypothetical protein
VSGLAAAGGAVADSISDEHMRRALGLPVGRTSDGGLRDEANPPRLSRDARRRLSAERARRARAEALLEISVGDPNVFGGPLDW